MTEPESFTSIPPAALCGARVRLRRWSQADHAPFAALNADPEVMKMFPATLARAQSDALASEIQRRITRRGWGLWAVEVLQGEHGAPQFIGFTGLNTPQVDLPFQPCVEVGWRLARKWWGQGLATEAAQVALRVGFEHLGLEEIVAFTARVNMRSRAVMRRLGMQEHPDDAFDHPSVPEASALRRHCLYRLTRKRWADAAGRRAMERQRHA